MTSARLVRLYQIAGLGEVGSAGGCQPNVHAPTAARIEPTVTQPSFDAVEEHMGSVYRYALRLAGRVDVAEDLAQETLLRAWRSRQRLRDQRVARVWLLRIATNLWTDELRQMRFRPRVLESEPPCPHPTAAKVADEREQVKLALAAMDELPPRQRQVLYLVTCEGLSHAEVADVLGIGLAAVKANLSLARKEMRRRLRDLYEQVCGRRVCRESS